MNGTFGFGLRSLGFPLLAAIAQTVERIFHTDVVVGATPACGTMSDYNKRISELTELASFDEADSYEVDMGGIYRDEKAGKFLLVTASGCSCWDGDYDEESYDTFDALTAALIGNDERRYNPSLLAAKEMIAEAKNKL